MAAKEIGKNVKVEVKGDVLTITVNLKGDQGASASGKTRIIGTTQGNVQLDGTDGAVLGLNLYRKV
jgi:hypothetical protein